MKIHRFLPWLVFLVVGVGAAVAFGQELLALNQLSPALHLLGGPIAAIVFLLTGVRFAWQVAARLDGARSHDDFAADALIARDGFITAGILGTVTGAILFFEGGGAAAHDLRPIGSAFWSTLIGQFLGYMATLVPPLVARLVPAMPAPKARPAPARRTTTRPAHQDEPRPARPAARPAPTAAPGVNFLGTSPWARDAHQEAASSHTPLLGPGHVPQTAEGGTR